MAAPVPFQKHPPTPTDRALDVFRELAAKSPDEFKALVVLARAALERLQDVAS